jgi:hypothetical protein
VPGDIEWREEVVAIALILSTDGRKSICRGNQFEDVGGRLETSFIAFKSGKELFAYAYLVVSLMMMNESLTNFLDK